MEGKKAILLILDGWGIGQVPASDAILAADTPVMDSLWKAYPHTTLVTYGEDVGLPEGQMGNSEVGHMNIGAGRIVYQELARINIAFREQTIDINPEMQAMLNYCRDHNKPLHLLCLVSDGGVHSHISHLKDTISIAEKSGLGEIYIHAFLDGRDTSPQGGIHYISDLLSFLQGKTAQLATVIGRYYSMDRDKRWERVKKAYDLLVRGIGDRQNDVLSFIQQNYSEGITDEFMPAWINPLIRQGSAPVIKDHDAVFFVNFRTDRPRQLTEVLTQQAYNKYDMKPMDLYFVTMTEYDSSFKNIHIIFHKDKLQNTLGEYLSKNNKTQWRIAETEKYPHVTYFFSGGIEEPFSGEKRYMAPSPKVATYDLAPEMSAHEVKDAILNAINTDQPDFICANFANTDMVGHTGVFRAAMKAAETVDSCVGEIISSALQNDYRLIIIADHGNSDYMINVDGSPNTAHTKNPVPCILVGNDTQKMHLIGGKLGDIAPTLLFMMGMQIPNEMTGQCLIIQ